MKKKIKNPRWISRYGLLSKKLKHRLLVYHYKNMLNKNYERTEVLAYILSKYSKKHIRD
jgi:hypothetical protein